MSELTKVVLSERDMPTHWYNINADLPAAGIELPPALHPGTGQPLGPADLVPLFPMALIEQEVSTERYIEIPDEVQEIYKLWRPTPLFRARRWEQALDTPAKIYFKYEGTSPSGSHKPNTAVPQAYYNMKEGVKRLATETGAVNLGQGFPDFDCDPTLVDAVTNAMRAGHNQYPPMAGLAALREAVAAKTEALVGTRYDPEREVTVTAGATQAIFTALLACVHPGDEVVVLEPCYDSCGDHARSGIDAGYAS